MPSLLRRALLLAIVFGATFAAAPALAAPNPGGNIPITEPASCATAPSSTDCENGVLAALDSARREIGLSSYDVPADFDSLSQNEQVFILANLDRSAYGLTPIAGLSSTLDQAAQAGADAGTDPNPTPYLPANLDLWGWDSNWAYGFPNMLYAYYEWMYYDGPGGTNLDCTSTDQDGCWGHRQDVLAFAGVGAIVMGAASSADANGDPSFAMTLVATQSADTSWTTLYYTWAEAQSDISGGGGGSSGGGGSTSGGSGGSSGSGGFGTWTSGSGSSGDSSPGSATPPAGGDSTPPTTSSPSPDTSAAQAPATPSASSTSPPAAATPSTPAQTVALAPPAVRIASASARGHAILFVLDASGQLAGLDCALVRGGPRRHGAPAYTACPASGAYRHLAAGRYTLFVRALGQGGTHGATRRRRFTIR